MARFALTPCKLRADRFVPQDGDPIDLDWRTLCERLAPSRSRTALITLRQVQQGAYVGLVRGPGGPRTFLLANADRSGDLTGILKKDPSFADRLLEVWRVDQVKWDCKTTEPL